VEGITAAEVLDLGLGMLIEGIQRLAELAFVEVLRIPGNHDRFFMYTVIKALDYYFMQDENVAVDTDHRSRKYRVIGKALVGWEHGSMPKKNAGGWLSIEAREEWGTTEWAEIHAGHWHAQITTEKNGLIIRYLSTMAPTNEWHFDKGYVGNVRSTASFLWDLEKELKEIWMTNIG
jgi:hypothetical protein